jgi:hypothetical protein
MAARWLFVAAASLWAAGQWLQSRLPEPDALVEAVRQDPMQTPTQAAPFVTPVGEVQYRVKPLFDYEIAGLVVSLHDTDAWWSIAHRDWNDRLNVRDLCLVWGKNAQTGGYQGVRYSSGQWTCTVKADTQASLEAFDLRSLSNNHILVDQPALARQLRSLQRGDQVLLRGHLVEYAHDHGLAFQRGTSTVREDTGNGACETLYIREVRVLRRGPGVWQWLNPLAAGLALLGLVMWWRRPLRSR